MTSLVKTAPAVLLVLAFASTPAPATPIPVIDSQQETFARLTASEKVSTKVERTKAWLKTKKAQTSRWVGRQKQKLKRAID